MLMRGIENGMGKRLGLAHRVADEERGSGMGSGDAARARSTSSSEWRARVGRCGTREQGKKGGSGMTLARGPARSEESGPGPVCTVRFLIYSKFSKLI
jgi:hypothetical protein